MLTKNAIFTPRRQEIPVFYIETEDLDVMHYAAYFDEI